MKPMVAVPAGLEAVWSECCIGLAGLIVGALFATSLPRLRGATTEGSGDWIPKSWRRVLLAVHGFCIVRELWRTWYRSHGFRWPAAGSRKGAKGDVAAGAEVAAPPPPAVDRWYIGDKDLAFFQYHAEEGGPLQGASAWQPMMQKDIPNVVRYSAWRRTLSCGKTEYKSVTLCPDATAQEFNDLYFDDDFRINWDEMVIHHEVLEHGSFGCRQQVVRWIRRFPFAFLSDREYVLARRAMRVGDTYYGLTKAVEHPRAPASGQVVHMDVFHSMWASTDIPCPWGSGRPACHTLLLHHEQFKIPENMARFAVRVGMWKFVHKLAEQVPRFVAARRARGAAPDAVDPQAYGAGCLPNPPMRRGGATELTDSSCTLSSLVSAEDDVEACAAGGGGGPSGAPGCAEEAARRLVQPAYVPRGGAMGGLRGVVVLALVGGLAAVLRGGLRRGGGGGTAAAAPSRVRRHRMSDAVRRELIEGRL